MVRLQVLRKRRRRQVHTIRTGPLRQSSRSIQQQLRLSTAVANGLHQRPRQIRLRGFSQVLLAHLDIVHAFARQSRDLCNQRILTRTFITRKHLSVCNRTSQHDFHDTSILSRRARFPVTFSRSVHPT